MTSAPWLGATVAGAAAAAAGPLLASWSASLVDRAGTGWWLPRPVSTRRRLAVTAAAVALAVLGSAGRPPLAWWLLAVGGAVLAAVDVQTHRLPARFTYPLAGAIAAALAGAALLTADPAGALRAAAAAVLVGGGYLAVRFVSPSALGQGDVRTAALAAGLAGYTGWAAVGQAQLLTVLLAAVTAIVLRRRPTATVTRTGQVPMGPAIVAGAVLSCWL